MTDETQAVPAEDVSNLVERLNGCAEAMDAAAKMAAVEQRHYRSDAVREAAVALTSLSAERERARESLREVQFVFGQTASELKRSEAEAASLRRKLEEAERMSAARPKISGAENELLIEWHGRVALSISKGEVGYAIMRDGIWEPGRHIVFDAPQEAAEEIARTLSGASE